jgi:tetratricopeptide (TPR) repeat protein
LVAAAREQLKAGRTQSAVIQLKGALQAQPDLPPARLLLGLTLLDQGLAAQALVELDKAAALGVPAEQVLPPTARAMLALGQLRQLIDRYEANPLPEGEAAADLRTSLAAAYAASGLQEQAAATLRPVLQRSPPHVPALLLQARMLAAQGNIDAALGQLDALLALDPQNPHAWQLRGDLLARERVPSPAALLAYRRAVALRPDQAPAHAGLISVLLRSGDVAAAMRQADVMNGAVPSSPLTLFARAQVAYAEGRLAPAQALGQAALRALPRDAQVLQFVGITELQRGAPLAAEPLLLRSLQAAPGDELTQHLLAAVYLATGQPSRVQSVLEPLLRQEDALALLEMAQAEQQTGQIKAVQALVQRARVARQAASEPASGVDGATGFDIDRMIVEGLIAGRQFEAALATLDDLEARRPGRTDVSLLRGRLLLARHDTTGARAAFERALLKAHALGTEGPAA